MIAWRSVIAQQCGRFVPVHDEDVEVAVVVKVAEGTTSADMARCDGWTRFVAEFNESPISLIAKDEAWIPRGIFGVDFSSSGATVPATMKMSG